MTEHELHDALGRLDRLRSAPGFPDGDWELALENEYALRARETAFIERERAGVTQTARRAPQDGKGVGRWFARLGAREPDPLFAWLARRATLAQLQWFLSQELAGDIGFPDLVALVQLHMPTRAKLELARSYWDGVITMADLLRARLIGALGASSAPPVWEALAVGNLLAGLAANRRYAYHALGALGIMLLTEGARIQRVDDGLQRCGVAARAREYCVRHARLGAAHGAAWIDEIIAPLVACDSRCALAIAEGALMQLRTCARAYARYRAELGAVEIAAA